MTNPVVAVGAVAAPLVGGWALLRGVLRRGRRGAKEAGKEKAEAEGGVAFCCERVCTSEALLRRLGSLAKARSRAQSPSASRAHVLCAAFLAQDPTPNTCVTVCGLSAVEACTEACQRAVCSGTHSVPAWNDACLRRCATGCLSLQGISS